MQVLLPAEPNKGHYDDLGYTSHFCWNYFHLLKISVFLNSSHFKSATEILSRFQIYQIISFRFAPELSVLLQSGLLTSNSCHPERFLFWSALDAVYWISCFSPWFYTHVLVELPEKRTMGDKFVEILYV